MSAHRFPPLASMLILVACAAMEAPADPAADRVAIDSLARQEMQALLAGDIEGHLATHASDAVVMPPGMPAARGLEAVHGVLTELHGMFDIDGTFTVGATTVDGDLAYQEMSYELTLTPKAGGETATDVGKGVHVLRRQPDGSWKIVFDMWNGSTPPEGM